MVPVNELPANAESLVTAVQSRLIFVHLLF